MKHTNYFSNASRAFTLLTIAGASLFFASCDKDDDTKEPEPTQTIWEIVGEQSDLSTIKGVLEDYELDAALQAEGEMTLFAPSNAAMTTLLTTLGLTSFDPVADDIALAVLNYHVANSAVLSSALPGSIVTLQGESITVTDGELVTGATSASKLVTADLRATNGVVHIVDVVLVPPTIGNLIVSNIGKTTQALLLAKDFTYLKQAILWADSDPNVAAADKLLAILGSSANEHTIFAPVNGVFEAAAGGAGVSVTQFIESFDKATMRAILTHHVVAGDIAPDQIQFNTPVATLFSSVNPNANLIFVNVGVGEGAGSYTGIVINSKGEAPPFEAEIALPDAFVSSVNGRVHAIAGLLAPM